MSMKRREFLELAGIASIGSLLPSTKSAMADSNRTYNLGVELGLTGAGALYSGDGLAAIKLASEEINKQGGFSWQISYQIIHKRHTYKTSCCRARGKRSDFA